jgi:hypothetical protein
LFPDPSWVFFTGRSNAYPEDEPNGHIAGIETAAEKTIPQEKREPCCLALKIFEGPREIREGNLPDPGHP